MEANTIGSIVVGVFGVVLFFLANVLRIAVMQRMWTPAEAKSIERFVRFLGQLGMILVLVSVSVALAQRCIGG